jgi:hypothetical protein
LNLGYFYFEGCKLEVPLTKQQKGIEVATPHASFLPTHLKDVSLELSCLKHLASKLKKVNSYLDMMAGSGFSVKLIDKLFAPSKVWVNDFSAECFDCLNHNFGKGSFEITQGDANQIILKNKWDLVFVDFNTFTLNHMDRWAGLFNSLKGKFRDLWFVDTACFSSLFGEKRFEQAYRVSSLKEYYELLGEILKIYKIYIYRVACFNNKKAAVVHAKSYYQKSFDLDYIDDNVQIQMSKNKGFDLV